MATLHDEHAVTRNEESNTMYRIPYTHTFSVTYETVTPESAELGDAEDRGWVIEDTDLRDAISACDGCGCECEADSSHGRPRWLTFYKVNDGTREYFEEGIEESRSLHIPDTVSDASARRIARLLGVYGF